MAFLASTAVLIRLVCRRRLKLKLSYDDYTIVFALVGIIAFFPKSWTSLIPISKC